ncbi:hypothetical protein NDU88_003673 [Pleurodeles waltl]|uniref:Uncharacterized protein n=1 Tax=Pleurodeles waltl TaxID=8319 RepID=A0AAV7T5Z7_PLEWA|nr:hypothetical protein NDU88_003673 [Pleurodeles waltl]
MRVSRKSVLSVWNCESRWKAFNARVLFERFGIGDTRSFEQTKNMPKKKDGLKRQAKDLEGQAEVNVDAEGRIEDGEHTKGQDVNEACNSHEGESHEADTSDYGLVGLEGMSKSGEVDGDGRIELDSGRQSLM